MRSAPVAAFVAAALWLATSAAYAEQPKVDIAAGKQKAETVCAACHGVDGNAVASTYPRLAGQHEQYLYKQLTEFKTGKRNNPVMLGMTATLTDADMRNVAAYYASQQPKALGASDKTQIEAGKKIYRGGVAKTGLPACMACHGPAGSGIPVQYPRVASQHGAYIEAQLKAFRSGERKNNSVMTDVAKKMSDDEIKAVSQYMQALN
ncbi:c-type cytochrome [Jeongeupia naejangsanensis]|uniref:Cytochrome c4 n=1 Tax=Jeongeupia naejangsanensis TaxID=613195 RepID=A0ABS2BJW6_9NEIS|nr:c-type cytochrome [Jeongeupia naejangsanensis]MBM3115886.1 cytochrome c4 [Jeongeupia naejangsanensis]